MKILVAGVGSLLKCDDGLGPHVVKELAKISLPSDVDVMDLGTSAMDVLHYSAGYDKAIFIDAVKLGRAVGTVYRITPREVPVTDEDFRGVIYMSMHEINLERVIALGRRLGSIPKDIVIIGCEPEDTTSMKIELTNRVMESVPKIIELVMEELKSSS